MKKFQIFYEDANELYAALREIDNALALSKEGLLKNDELEQIEQRSIDRMEKNFEGDSLAYRKFDRFKSKTRWKDVYPKDYVDFNYANSMLRELKEIIAESIDGDTSPQKIVKELKSDNFKVQSNQDGDDEHLMIFDRKDHSGEHVHLIADGQSGEMRIDPKDKSPHDLLEKVVSITTKTGEQIRSTKATLEFLDHDSNDTNKPNIAFELNKDKFMHWGCHATGFNLVWGFGLTLRINNFRNNMPDYVSVKLKGNTSEGIWESQHFIFHETKEKSGRPDEPFEVAPHKITEIGVVLSQDYPEHSPLNNQKVAKPDLDTVVLIVSTESGVKQDIKIKSKLVSNA